MKPLLDLCVALIVFVLMFAAVVAVIWVIASLVEGV